MMQDQARVVIVGGGMLGCGLLYHLALEGWTDCLLIEKGELTSGSTWHAAGQCPSFIADFSMAKIHHHGNTLYPKLEALTGQYVSWHGCGGIRIATKPEEVDFFRHVEGVAKLIGFRMQVIGPDEIKRLNPFLDTNGVLAGAWTLDDGHVDPAGCCNALAKGARDLGAAIERRTLVTGIERADEDWIVRTDKGDVRAEHVVNAAGCYARRVSQMVGAPTPIANMTHHYLVTDPIPAFQERSDELPVMRDPYPDAYYRQEQKAGLIGIYETEGAPLAWPETGNDPEWPSENELFTDELDRIAEPWVARVMERMPILGESGIRRIVHGAIAHTPDDNPLVGPAPGLKNFWQCCGASIGIAQGAGIGKYLAQWIVHGEAEINMGGLDPRRFGDWADRAHVEARSIEGYQHMYALHLPGEERPAGRMARTTPLHETLAARGAQFESVAGWERPKYFGPEETPGYRRTEGFEAAARECRAAMEAAALFELSSFAKFDVTGTGALAFLDRVFANRMPAKDGRIALAHLLNENGVIEGEATVTRLAEDRFYLLSGAASELRDFDRLTQSIRPGEEVVVRPVTTAFGNLVLVGPKARDILAGLTDADLSNAAFPWLSAQEIEVAGVPVRALRVNYVGELGWELHAPMERLPNLFAALHEAGDPLGLADAGTRAVNAMRLEKAYRGYGSELTNEITPVEAGLERFVGWQKPDFVGKAACERRRQGGIAQQLVYCALDPEAVAEHRLDARGGEAVLDGERAIGITTSGGYGHRTGRSLAFAYVDPAHAEPGRRFDLWLMGERIGAEVLPGPAYDPENARLKA
jgi:dimethylglycine dehydrogenase